MHSIIGQATVRMITVPMLKSKNLDLKFYFRVTGMSGGLESTTRWIFTLCEPGLSHHDFWSLGLPYII